MSNQTKLQNVFRKVLSIPETVDVINVKYGESPGRDWDSLQHMLLITLIEDEFDLMIEINDVSEIRSYIDAETVLSKYGVDFQV